WCDNGSAGFRDGAAPPSRSRARWWPRSPWRGTAARRRRGHGPRATSMDPLIWPSDQEANDRNVTCQGEKSAEGRDRAATGSAAWAKWPRTFVVDAAAAADLGSRR